MPSRALSIRTAAILVAALSAVPAGAAEVAEAPKLIVVVPLGAPSPDLVDAVVESIRARFNFEVRVAAPVPLPKDAWYEPRKRWRAEKILDALDALDTGDVAGAWRLAAITEEPISTTKGKIKDWGIAGLGSLGGRSSVFTSHLFQRFRTSDRPTYLRFMENLVIHELGHTLGLDHCPLERCIMADAKGDAIRSARISLNEFCPHCHRQIQHYLKSPEQRGAWTEAERKQAEQLSAQRESSPR